MSFHKRSFSVWNVATLYGKITYFRYIFDKKVIFCLFNASHMNVWYNRELNDNTFTDFADLQTLKNQISTNFDKVKFFALKYFTVIISTVNIS